MPHTLGSGQGWPHLELLAVKGEHVFLVPSDQDDWRSEVLGQGLQPGHVQGAGALPLSPYGQGAARQGGAERNYLGSPHAAQPMLFF